MFAGVLSALKAVIIKRERAFDWLFDRLIMWSSRKIVLFEKLLFLRNIWFIGFVTRVCLLKLLWIHKNVKLKMK